MADIQTYNLDDVNEYFSFTIFGHTYKMKYPNSDELKSMKGLKEDEDRMKVFFSSLVTKTDETSLDFSEVIGKMQLPHWKKFIKMIESEFSV